MNYVAFCSMKLNAEHMRAAIQAIMDDDGYSPEEIANKAGLNKSAIYKILNGNTTAVRRSTIRQIAEATGRQFVISGDKVTFVIAPKQENDNLTEEEREFLNMFRQLDETSQDAAIGLLESMCRVAELGRKRRERSPSSEN